MRVFDSLFLQPGTIRGSEAIPSKKRCPGSNGGHEWWLPALFAVFLLGAPFAFGGESVSLEKIQAGYSRVAAAEEREFEAYVARLRKSYQASLEKILRSLISGGDAEDAIGFKKEIELVDSGDPITMKSDGGETARVLEMRKKFVKARKSYEEARDAEIAALKLQGVKALKRLARAVTRSGDLEKVEKIQDQIEEWESGETPSEQVEDRIARIDAVGGGEIEDFEEGEILWADKRVEIREPPDELDGLSFVHDTRERCAAEVIGAGTVYVVTAAPGTVNDRSAALEAAGFRRSSIPVFQLYGGHRWDQVETYEKVVQEGEALSFDKYGIIVGRR